MAKRETMMLSWELKVDSICNMVLTIHHLFFTGIVMFASPASVNLGEWYCHVSDVIIQLDIFRTMTITFSIAVYRYIFIVHGKLISSKKRKKLIRRTLFATKSIFLVLFTSKFIIFEGRVNFWESLCNECEFGLTPNDPEFGLTTNYQNATFLGRLTSELFYFTHPDPGKNAMVTIFGLIENDALAVSLKVFCIIVDLLLIVSILNVTEGVLHCRIGKFLKK